MTRHGANEPRPQAPNVVFILPDQLRADFLGCYGGRAVPTPNIDRLASVGVRYTNAVTGSPLCVPARTSLLTGMNAMKNGVLDNLGFLRPDYGAMGIRTWPETLAGAGYHTASVGKMHFYPWDAPLGFQRRVVAEDKVWPYIRDDFYHALRSSGQRKPQLGENAATETGSIVELNRLERRLTADGFVGDQACHFIDTYGSDGPFAIMVGFPGPHDPYDPRPDSLLRVNNAGLPSPVPADAATSGLRSRYAANQQGYRSRGGTGKEAYTEAEVTQLRRHYAASVAQIDDEVGRIVQSIRARGIEDNTVIIVSSDHGDHLGDHGFVGAKNSFFESAIRVPLIVAGGAYSGGVAREELVEILDITSTLLTIAGCTPAPYMDSIPLAGPRNVGDGHQRKRQEVYGFLSDAWMVLDGRWKLHQYSSGDTFLHDLLNDPQEQENRVSDPRHAELRQSLERKLTLAAMASVRALSSDRRVADNIWDLVDDHVSFGREGWNRTYPHPIGPA